MCFLCVKERRHSPDERLTREITEAFGQNTAVKGTVMNKPFKVLASPEGLVLGNPVVCYLSFHRVSWVGGCVPATTHLRVEEIRR